MLPDRAGLTLMAHSGGGSLLFGFLNARNEVPDDIERFVFLDANYGFSREDGHDRKMSEWLRRTSRHSLIVVAYDDRNITLNGKNVIGPDGGTYRRSLEMLRSFRDAGMEFTESQDSVFVTYRSASPAIVIAIHRNPSNAVLHTLLVERNGFLFGAIAFTPLEARVGRLWGLVEYSPFVVP
jgi:hypothetical protein